MKQIYLLSCCIIYHSREAGNTGKAENWTITSVDYSEYDMHCSHTFISSHWLPAAEGTTSTLCTNSYPYKVLLAHFQVCDVEWWGGRCAGVCGGSGNGPPILNGVLWVGQPTQVSWRRPGDPDCSLQYQPLQWDVLWGTHCSKGSGTVTWLWYMWYVVVWTVLHQHNWNS